MLGSEKVTINKPTFIEFCLQVNRKLHSEVASIIFDVSSTTWTTNFKEIDVNNNGEIDLYEFVASAELLARVIGPVWTIERLFWNLVGYILGVIERAARIKPNEEGKLKSIIESKHKNRIVWCLTLMNLIIVSLKRDSQERTEVIVLVSIQLFIFSIFTIEQFAIIWCRGFKNYAALYWVDFGVIALCWYGFSRKLFSDVTFRR